MLLLLRAYNTRCKCFLFFLCMGLCGRLCKSGVWFACHDMTYDPTGSTNDDLFIPHKHITSTCGTHHVQGITPICACMHVWKTCSSAWHVGAQLIFQIPLCTYTLLPYTHGEHNLETTCTNMLRIMLSLVFRGC